ncbi:MAG TPA: hypothetical protein VGQ83_09830 [Polyangia bacterium]|jgi:hypothetical protein
MTRYAIGFALVMGLGMLGMWAMFFVTAGVPEVRSAPIALGFHLAGEVVTALSLIAAAIGLMRRTRWARGLYLFALGAFVYTAIVSPGYFAQRGQWPLVGMFAAFILAAVPAAVAAIRGDR